MATREMDERLVLTAAKREEAAMPRRRTQVLIAFTLLLGLFCVYSLNGWTVRDVHISVEGESSALVRVFGRRVDAALHAAGVRLGPGDKVWPSLDTPLQHVEEVVVRRGVPVTVQVGSETIHGHTAAFSVREGLKDLGFDIGPLDRTTPSGWRPIEPEMSITLVRVTEEIVEEISPLPFQTVRWADPDITAGSSRVIREGSDGLLRADVRLIRENGRLVSREILSTDVLEEPVDRIVGIGTRPELKIVRDPSGAEYVYVDTIDVEATAYEPGPISTGAWSDGITFTGLRAQKGVIAVDPEVIPLGTRLYVPGYGEGLAADIGGAIKGNRIDVFFPTYDEAIQWGRKRLTVYILADEY